MLTLPPPVPPTQRTHVDEERRFFAAQIRHAARRHADAEERANTVGARPYRHAVNSRGDVISSPTVIYCSGNAIRVAIDD